MAHCSIVGCNNKQANDSEVTYFNLPKNPQRQKNCLAAIPSNVLFVAITFKTNILINHGIYKTSFSTEADQ